MDYEINEADDAQQYGDYGPEDDYGYGGGGPGGEQMSRS